MQTIIHMYALKDELLGYIALIPFMGDHHEDLAKDYLIDHLIDDPPVRNHPKRFSVWHMGTWDKASGTFIQKPDDIKKIYSGEEYENAYKKRTL